jgi:hypothetical protein
VKLCLSVTSCSLALFLTDCSVAKATLLGELPDKYLSKRKVDASDTAIQYWLRQGIDIDRTE